MADPLSPARVRDAHYVHRTHWAEVPSGTTLEDVLDPKFWAYNTGQIRQHDKIEVLSDDGLLDCELRVIAVGSMLISVRLIRAPIESAAPAAVTADEAKNLPRVEHAGPHHKWRVLDLQGDVIAHGFATKDEAKAKLDEYRTHARIAA